MDPILGVHKVRQEGDVVVLTLNGDLAKSEMEQLLLFIQAVVERHGQYGTIINIWSLGSIHADARRVVGQWQGHRLCYGNAIYGGSASARILMTLLGRAIQLFSAQHNTISFCKTEEEARAWLEARRLKAANKTQAAAVKHLKD